MGGYEKLNKHPKGISFNGYWGINYRYHINCWYANTCIKYRKISQKQFLLPLKSFKISLTTPVYTLDWFGKPFLNKQPKVNFSPKRTELKHNLNWSGECRKPTLIFFLRKKNSWHLLSMYISSSTVLRASHAWSHSIVTPILWDRCCFYYCLRVTDVATES